jgi:hypothetical protein
VPRRIAIIGKPDRAGPRQRLEVDRTVAAAMGCTVTNASRPVRRFNSSSAATESSAGSVFGMQKTVVNPPAAAAAVPDSIVSFHS